MTRNERITKLKKEAPEEFGRFMNAGKLTKDLIGFSVTADRETFEKIKEILNFEPGTKDGKLLKDRILAKAKAKANEGMLGNGVFFID